MDCSLLHRSHAALRWCVCSCCTRYYTKDDAEVDNLLSVVDLGTATQVTDSTAVRKNIVMLAYVQASSCPPYLAPPHALRVCVRHCVQTIQKVERRVVNIFTPSRTFHFAPESINSVCGCTPTLVYTCNGAHNKTVLPHSPPIRHTWRQ